MIQFNSLAAFAAFATGLIVKVEHAKHEALEHACRVVEKEAKSYPGSYQAGWPALKPETIARKATGDSPLLETGEMRDSIEHKVVSKDEAWVGSNNDKMIWQELGTSRGIPPRSVLELAGVTKGPEVVKILGDAVVMALEGRGTSHKGYDLGTKMIY